MDSLVSIVIIIVLIIFFGALLKRCIHQVTRIADSLLEAAVATTAVIRINATLYKNQALLEASKKLGDEPINEEELLRKLRGE